MRTLERASSEDGLTYQDWLHHGETMDLQISDRDRLERHAPGLWGGSPPVPQAGPTPTDRKAA